jgi:spermidine synthase
VTIGIYIAAMGFGALFYKKIIPGNRLINSFLKVELLLSFLGSVSPALVLIVDYFANKFSSIAGVHFYHPIVQLPIFTINHLLIFLIGFISGLELPLLIDIGKKLSSSKNNHVLAFDYFGTLIGAIIFPLILLPSFSLFGLGFTISFLNILVAVVVSIKMKDVERKWMVVAFLGLIISTFLIVMSSPISDYLINTFYFAGKFK